MLEEPDNQNKPIAEPSAEAEPVWTFRGYKLRPNDFTTAMVHFFRAEISRANVWRQRLDATTNWAVVTTGAAISFSFGQPEGHHSVILLNTMLVTMFLAIEARRYRYYELWSSRVRLMETDFFAAMLVPPFGPAPDWAESLAENLLHPQFPISLWEAMGRRFRRNYFYIYVILGIAWLAKLWLHPFLADSLPVMMQRATIGVLPGSSVIAIFLFSLTVLFLLGFLTRSLHSASGEVLPRFGPDMDETLKQAVEGGKPASWRAWFRHSTQRRQLLAFIITDRPQQVSQGVLDEMKRGLTEISGRGMFTGKAHSVLMCALTVTEVSHLKAIVSSVDEAAFMIVSPVQEVLGKGFLPIQRGK
ncbi:MAG: DUF2270 domain-containing protein [Anaerolineales bacterium]|nr:DUF2270 domain-containing protein [Anaerolineales bacterium]